MSCDSEFASLAAASGEHTRKPPTWWLKNEFVAFEALLKERFPAKKIFNKQETILRSCDSIYQNTYYYVCSGTAAFYLLSDDGLIKNSYYRGEGAIMPLYCSIPLARMEFVIEAIAVDNVQVLVMQSYELENLMRKEPDFAIAMCNAYAEYSRILLYESASQYFYSAYHRVCNFLRLCCINGNKSINLKHEEIGKVININRSNTTRIINNLCSQGIIRSSRNNRPLAKIK